MVIEKNINKIQYSVVFSWWKEKEIIENFDIDKQVESLIKKIQFEIIEEGNTMNIMVKINNEEVAYIQLLNVWFHMCLKTFYNCNAKWKIDEDDLYRFAIEKLADKKIPLLWLSIMIKIIELIKEKFVNMRKLMLVESSYAEERWFYQKTFDYMKEKWYIKDYKKRWRNYFIILY